MQLRSTDPVSLDERWRKFETSEACVREQAEQLAAAVNGIDRDPTEQLKALGKTISVRSPPLSAPFAI